MVVALSSSLALAGCAHAVQGGSAAAGSGSATAASNSAAPTSSPALAAAASSSGLKKVDVRAIVPAAKLSSLTGRQYVSAAENNHATPEIHGCSYQGAGGDQSMLTFDLAIDYGGGSTDLNAEVDQIKDDGENPISLSTLASSNAKAVSQLVIAQYGQDDAYAVDALYPSGTRELTTAQLIQVVKALVAGSR